MTDTSLLTMTRGDTANFAVTVTDGAGAPLNLTGLVLTFTVAASSQSAVITKTIGAGITVTDALGGLATVTISPADTDGLEDRAELFWDLEVDSAGDIRTPLTGRLSVEVDVTP